MLPLLAFFFFMTLSPAFAQESVNSTEIRLQGNQTSGEPALAQMSDKGIYKVLLRWPTQVLDQESGLEVEIVFFNASAPLVPENISRTDYTTSAQHPTGLDVPESIESTLPVESYDITVYASNGSELFKRLDQPGLGGRGSQNFKLEANHLGPVTIVITDIRPGWDSGKVAGEDQIDSVTFATAIVPEFPFSALGIMIAILGTVVVMGFRFGLIR